MVAIKLPRVHGCIACLCMKATAQTCKGCPELWSTTKVCAVYCAPRTMQANTQDTSMCSCVACEWFKVHDECTCDDRHEQTDRQLHKWYKTAMHARCIKHKQRLSNALYSRFIASLKLNITTRYTKKHSNDRKRGRRTVNKHIYGEHCEWVYVVIATCIRFARLVFKGANKTNWTVPSEMWGLISGGSSSRYILPGREGGRCMLCCMHVNQCICKHNTIILAD